MTDVEALRDQIARLSAQVAESRGDMRESVAELRGAINTLAADKSGEVRQLRDGVNDVRDEYRENKARLKSLHERLDGVAEQATQNRVKIAGLIGSSSLLSAALTTYLQQVVL